MIFTKVEAGQICRGKKTMLLAPARRDDFSGRYLPPRRFRTGNDLGVQPAAGATELCRIVITSVDLRQLADLEYADARQLGYRIRADLAADWLDRHDPSWPVMEEALCETCDGHAETPDGDDCPDCEIGVVEEPKKLTEDQTLELFRQRVGNRSVWVVAFAIPDEIPRMLAAHSERGYTTRRYDALPGEPEAIDEITQARLTKRAHEREKETAAERQRREHDELDAEIAAFLARRGIPETDGGARARVRDAVQRAMRRRDRDAA